MKNQIIFRDIALITCSGTFEEEMLRLCLLTLRKYNRTCEIRFYTHGVSPRKREWLTRKFNLNISDLSDKDWVEREQASKIYKIKELGLVDGDRVLFLDADLVFRDDPFKVFEEDFDVFVTSRYYAYPYPLNAGVWGFKYNDNSRRFLEFYLEQVTSPDWDPLVTLYNRYSHTGRWLDQDFLCVWFMIGLLKSEGKISVPWQEDKELLEALRKAELPFDVRMYDAGPEYNYAPATILGTREEIVTDVRAKLKDKETKIIHLKGLLHSRKYLTRLGLYRFGWAQRLSQIVFHR